MGLLGSPSASHDPFDRITWGDPACPWALQLGGGWSRNEGRHGIGVRWSEREEGRDRVSSLRMGIPGVPVQMRGWEDWMGMHVDEGWRCSASRDREAGMGGLGEMVRFGDYGYMEMGFVYGGGLGVDPRVEKG